MKLSIIAAAAENGVIGKGNQLPWHIKSELKYYLGVVRGKPVIEGRMTFESRGSVPYKGSPNIVVTRNTGYSHPGIITAPNLNAAIDEARRLAAESGQSEVMIGGGAEIYKLALPLADRIYLTEVHMQPEGDALFPAFDRAGWTETKTEFHKAQAGEDADYTIRVFERKKT